MIAITICPVSIAVSIMMTQVFVSTLTGFFLAGEKISVYEIISIIGGFFGVILLVNDQFFTSDHTKSDKRHKDDMDKYPYYYIGILMAILYTIFSALNFHKMREMGANVHSSIKTFYFGALHTILTLIWISFAGPSVFCFWNIGQDSYPLSRSQFMASSGVGFFSWLN